VNINQQMSDVNAAGGAPAVATEGMSPGAVFNRVGELTRKLHDALQALGYHNDVQNPFGSLPGARARLDYVAELTGKAAERVLSAAETGRSIQEELEVQARALNGSWEAAGANPDTALLDENRKFIAMVCQGATATNSQFTEIMLAQDFHDLTGQTINRIIKLSSNLQIQLLNLLLDATLPEKRVATERHGMAGEPVPPRPADSNVVIGQAQVDDLLESLGF
jgi:chemotaxis protein CheZ